VIPPGRGVVIPGPGLASVECTSGVDAADDAVGGAELVEDARDIGVVGAGLAGLAAACTLAARGHKVVLFDKNPWLGGDALAANVRRQLRHVLGGAGIERVTPHMFRRTVATAVNANANIELAAELLGHTDTKITVQHYIQRSELVNPATAALLDRAFAKDQD